MIFTKTIIEAMKHWVNGRLTNYVEIVKGKGLSTEDYTSEEKEKLSTVQAGAEKNAQPDWNETDETQNSFILNKPNIPDTSGFISVPTASVGQTIAVKAVDENGKPTEWEAVDIAKELTKIRMTVDGDIINCDYDANAIAGMMSPDTVVIIERIGLNANLETSMINSQGYDIIAIYDASYNPVKF